ncbi:MAG: ribosome recycling factor [Candidatus Paracaedibacteraceae bacterium]|nr:ribosome recycling factor [Candidatus Paracaedibacteraceae bacterium]
MQSFSELSTELHEKMGAAIEYTKKEFAGLRAGRASPQLLESVMVEAYGNNTPLLQLGNINIPEPRMLSVQVWDKGLVKSVEKAIRDAGLGLNPVADGQVVRVPVPQLNEERRKEMVKIASKYAEEGRISIRNIRRHGLDILKKMEKDKVVSEDEAARHEKDIQKLTDEYIEKVDVLLVQKEKDIMQV